MEKYEKEVARAQLNNEKDVLEKLKEQYQNALDDINEKLASLLTREDSDMQYVIYQVQYQHALKKQIQSILIQLQNDEFDSISEYLTKCYEDGYEGALYALQKQGIPLAIPIDQDLVVEAIQHETKLSEDLYTSLGKNIEDMQKKIQSEISRGIATGKMYQDIAADLSRSAGVSYNNAMRIARTEGHRIQCKATMDACYKAQDRGAEIVKQWNAALDARTRDSHLKIDGEIKNLDEKFSNGLLYPGDPAGKASEVINCRCTLSQRARWALEWSNQTKYLGDTDAMSDKQLQIIADKLHISVSELKEYSKQIIPIKAKDYSDFKEQYSKIWNYHGSKAEKEAKERIEKRRTEQREKKKEERKKQKQPEYEGGIPKNWKKIDIAEDDAVRNANPNYNLNVDAYTKNCSNCACAYEMRKRGYDVIAQPYIHGGKHHLTRNPWDAWENPSVETILSKDKLEEYVKKYTDGSRFGIAYIRKDNTGHVLVGEKEDGALKIYDPQSGYMRESLDFDNMEDVKLWQTDNLELSDRGATACDGR